MNTEPSATDRTEAQRQDIVIIGGALAGAATAILILRERPGLRITILERSEQFSKKVGEATVEISSYFLCRVMGLTQYLNHTQLVKQGMRFWFCNQNTHNLGDCSELGGRYLARVASFQLDRSQVDQELLNRAVALGVTLLRPAQVQNVELQEGGLQIITGTAEGRPFRLQARWVVDASGVASFLARKQGWWRANTEHPTSSAWARWRGVKDWDGRELATKYPEWSRRCCGMRGTATNHFMGDGWWAWCIPLRCGEMSVGVVMDQRLVDWPAHGRLEQRLKNFLCQHPAARELLADAECVAGDVHWRKNLPYYSTTFAGNGFCLVGDAAGFIDPFYSPGLDWLAFSSTMAARLIVAERAGENVAPLIKHHNDWLAKSYRNWFTALYKDKYEYFGDYELMNVAFRLDVGLYFLGPAPEPFKRGLESYWEPLFSTPLSQPAYWFMATYNRRLASMGRNRRQRGKFGEQNTRMTTLLEGYSFNRKTLLPMMGATMDWLMLEAREGWRSWFAREKRPVAMPQPQEEAV